MKGLGQTYAVVGNHDSSPVNSFPPAAVDTTITTQWAYDVLASEWASWIGSIAAAEADSNYGSYSVLTSEGLRMISVNTNFWYKVFETFLTVGKSKLIGYSKTSGYMNQRWKATLVVNFLGSSPSSRLLRLPENEFG